MLYEEMEHPPKKGDVCRVTYSVELNEPTPTKTFVGKFVRLWPGGGGRWEQEYLVDGKSIRLMDDREVFECEVLQEVDHEIRLEVKKKGESPSRS